MAKATTIERPAERSDAEVASADKAAPKLVIRKDTPPPAPPPRDAARESALTRAVQ